MRLGRIGFDPMARTAPVGFSHSRRYEGALLPMPERKAREAAPVRERIDAAALLAALKAAGWSWRRVARELGANESSIYYWKRGGQPMPVAAARLVELHRRACAGAGEPGRLPDSPESPGARARVGVAAGLLRDLKLAGWAYSRIAAELGVHEQNLYYWKRGGEPRSGVAARLVALHQFVMAADDSDAEDGERLSSPVPKRAAHLSEVVVMHEAPEMIEALRRCGWQIGGLAAALHVSTRSILRWAARYPVKRRYLARLEELHRRHVLKT